jgi:hypothetical protein
MPRAAPIREGTPEKEALIALFESKKWERFPTTMDTELQEMMDANNWNKKQVASHFGVWFRLGRSAGSSLERSKEDVLQSLKEKCHSNAELLDHAWKSN